MFEKFISKLKLCVKFVFYNFSVCLLGYFMSPGLIYLLKGSVDFILPAFIPGIDPFSNWGYPITTIYHIYIGFLSVGVYLFSDGLFTVQVLHVSLLSDILRNEIRKIDKLVASSNASATWTRIHFRNLLMLHNEMVT